MEDRLAEMPPEMEFQWRRPQTFFPLAMAATTSPRAFFAAMPKDGGWLPPLAFLLVAQLVPTLVQALLQLPQLGPRVFGLMVLALGNTLAKFLIATAILWLVARVAFRADITLQGVLRILCYTSGLWVIWAAQAVLSLQTAALILVILVIVQLYLVQAGLQVVGRLPTIHADATRSPFRAGSFDAAITWSVLNVMPPEIMRATLREIRRVMRGTLIVMEEDARHDTDVSAEEHALAEWYFAHDYEAEFAAAGFQVRQVVTLDDLQVMRYTVYVLTSP